MTIVVIGEILWDVFEKSETLGGASFNFAVQCTRLGHRAIFLSAVGDDDRGRLARERAEELGLDPTFIQIVQEVRTGEVTVRLDSNGEPEFQLHRPAAYDHLTLSDETLGRIRSLQPAWVYYGTLHQIYPSIKAETKRLIAALPNARRFYDINLRPDCYTPELVRELMAAADAVKVNQAEAKEFPEFWSRPIVAITRGSKGCSVRIGDDFAECPGEPITVADTVGAGDAFAAAFFHGLQQGWDAAATGAFANHVGATVASRSGAISDI